jgi:hypothetical protein
MPDSDERLRVVLGCQCRSGEVVDVERETERPSGRAGHRNEPKPAKAAEHLRDCPHATGPARNQIAFRVVTTDATVGKRIDQG